MYNFSIHLKIISKSISRNGVLAFWSFKAISKRLVSRHHKGPTFWQSSQTKNQLFRKEILPVLTLEPLTMKLLWITSFSFFIQYTVEETESRTRVEPLCYYHVDIPIHMPNKSLRNWLWKCFTLVCCTTFSSVATFS